MSNRLFQGVIHQLRDAVERTIGVIDETGTIISCSELGKIGEVISAVPSTLFTEREIIRSKRGTGYALAPGILPKFV